MPEQNSGINSDYRGGDLKCQKKCTAFSSDYRAGNGEFTGAGEPRVRSAVPTDQEYSGCQQQAEWCAEPVSEVDRLKAYGPVRS